MGMQAFRSPRSVAVIGAARERGKLGRDVLQNVVAGDFRGRVFPVNPHARRLLDLPCYPSVLDVPGEVDLAAVVVPVAAVNAVARQCAAKGVGGLVVITAGFGEAGPAGKAAERELVAVARESGMRLLGPNCLGLIDTGAALNLSFAQGMPAAGNVSFLSQSGAVGTAALGMARDLGMGFAKFVSLGNKADLNEADFLELLAEDPATGVVAMYLENVVQGQRFLQVAARITAEKPVLVLKAGGTGAGARAASSHTGALAGADTTYRAAFRQVGVVAVTSMEELFDQALALSRQPLPAGRRVLIVTNAGGPGIMAADACERGGLQVPSLEADTAARLRRVLPPTANVYNPVDLVGDAGADRYRAALEITAGAADATLVLLTPQTVTQIPETAQAVVEAARGGGTVLACFMGGTAVAQGVAVLTRGGVPNYPFPERAVDSLAAMIRCREGRERPAHPAPSLSVDAAAARTALTAATERGEYLLGDWPARPVLEAYGLTLTRARLAAGREEAAAAARELGYPVGLKVVSSDILHKTDVGGVAGAIANEAALIDAYDRLLGRVRRLAPRARLAGVEVVEWVPGGVEMVVGMTRDPQFGPVVMAGLGGIFVEVLADVAFRVAPLGADDAREMLRELKGYPILAGVRGRPGADVAALEEVILRVARLAVDLPEVVELDLNPVLVRERGRGAVVADSRLGLAAQMQGGEGE
jgi:acetyltransferase